ncbi:hypothetical protein Tco_0465419 [Tanacetum coccineum]
MNMISCFGIPVFHPAGSAPPLSGSAAPTSAGGYLVFLTPLFLLQQQWISAGSHHELGISPFADSDISFFPSPDETMSESASSPPRSRRKHRGVRSDDSLWAKPVEDFFSSESESDDDMENYIPPIPYGAFKDWEIVRCPLRSSSFTSSNESYFVLNPDVDVGLDLWRDVNLLCQSLHSDDVEDFWRTQDEWVVSSWKLYPKSSVHVLDLTNGKTVYMFVDKVYPIRATLLERMLRHRLTVPPSYCRDVVVAGNAVQTVQAGLRESYECLASVPIACTARQMVFSSPWLTATKESGSPLQTALVCNSNPLIALLLRDVAASVDSAVHRVHAVSFDAAVASLVSAACVAVAAYFVPAALQSSCFEKIYLETWN